MKLKTSSKPKTPVKRGRKSVLGGERLNFFPGTELKQDIEDTKERAERLKLPKLSDAYILREGAKLFLAQTNAAMNKVESGTFHAKKRGAIVSTVTNTPKGVNKALERE